jgi:hypothetical protein
MEQIGAVVKRGRWWEWGYPVELQPEVYDCGPIPTIKIT